MIKKFFLISIIVLLYININARYIRINQAGYLISDQKIANLFSNENLNSFQFSVLRVSDNAVVFGPASVGTNLGSYSGYSYHYKLNFTSLNTTGTYYIRLSDGITQSYQFEVNDCVYGNAPDSILNFLRAQRCGYNPYLGASCHLFSGTTRLDGRAVGGPNNGTNFDVSGGWHDAGDYIKFMINIADVTFLLLFAYQENPGVFADNFLANGTTGSNGIPDVLDEAKYGLDWIMKMHPSANVFYYQVADENDHNTGWILPQNDNASYPTNPYRPVYHCDAGKGANVAGKAAAALALADIIWRGRGDTAYADLCRTHAQQIYTFGKNNQSAQPSKPADFYGETTWMDDMQLAAVELYKATGVSSYLTDAETWAPSVGSAWGWTDWGTLNFFAHYELYKVTTNTTLKNQLKQYMQQDLNANVTYANADRFGMAAEYVWGSQAINTAGVLNAYLYKKLFNETTYDSMATGARDYILGKNQWSVCFIVGMGDDFPNDTHHGISVVNNVDIPGMPIEGPVSQSNWLSYGAPAPPSDPYSAFQSSTAVYYDYREDYSTNEPTIWQAGLTLAMFSFLSSSTCLGPTPTFTRTNTPGGPSPTRTMTHTITPTLTRTPTFTQTAQQPQGGMLDNFEDGEFTVNNSGGGWYEFAEPATSSVLRTIITGDVPTGGGTYSGRISGNVIGPSGSWASIGAGTNLNAPATPENLNLATGIRLYMKGNYGTGTNVAFRIQIVSTNITDFSFWNFNWIPQPNWTYVTIPWTSFSPPGWGQGNGMTLSQVLSQVQAIQFSIADTTGGAVNNTGNNWYIDNIEIYGISTVTNTPTNTPYAGTSTNTPTITPTTEKCRRFLAYYPYWVSTYRADKIPYNRLTHICHAFVQPQANGSLFAPSGYLEPALITNAHAAGVKVLVSIGGADEVARQNFVTIAASASLRTAFANAVEAFCRTYGYDGADIDWEFPQNATERTNQNLLIQAVRDKFNSSPAPAPSWEITMAISPGNWYGQWNDYSYLNNVVNFYNLMTYDYHGEWSSHSGHNSPLYRGTDPLDGENIDWSHNYMTVTRGVPASKMNLGVPFYGYRFPNSETLYDGFVSGATQMNYNTITPLIGSGWTYNWDSGSYVPYLTYNSGAGLICYDNPSSVSEKVNYALNLKGYGGIFMWEITADYSAGSQPLFDAMWNSYASFCGLTTPTFTRTRTPTIAASFTMTRTRTQTYTLTRTGTATRTNTQIITNTWTGTPTRTASPTGTRTVTPTNTITATGTYTRTETSTQTRTLTITSTYTRTISPTHSVSSSITQTWTGTPPSPTNTPTRTFSWTVSPTQTWTGTPTYTRTPTETSSRTPTETNTTIPTSTYTRTQMPTATNTSILPGMTWTNSYTPSALVSVTGTRTITPVFTQTATDTRQPTISFTVTDTISSNTPTVTQTWTITGTNTVTQTRTLTLTYTLTRTPTASMTNTFTPLLPTYTPTFTETPTGNRQPIIGNVVIYPNPYNTSKQDLKIKFTLEGGYKLIKVKIYTAGFRTIKQFIFEGNYMPGEHIINIERKYLYKLANGVYFLLITSQNTKSKPIEFIILR